MQLILHLSHCCLVTPIVWWTVLVEFPSSLCNSGEKISGVFQCVPSKAILSVCFSRNVTHRFEISTKVLRDVYPKAGSFSGSDNKLEFQTMKINNNLAFCRLGVCNPQLVFIYQHRSQAIPKWLIWGIPNTQDKVGYLALVFISSRKS